MIEYDMDNTEQKREVFVVKCYAGYLRGVGGRSELVPLSGARVFTAKHFAQRALDEAYKYNSRIKKIPKETFVICRAVLFESEFLSTKEQ